MDPDPPPGTPVDASDLVPVVGVGPWPGGEDAQRRAAAQDACLDPQLLREGDRRNVVDRYRYWRLDAIVADLDTRRHGFEVAIENFTHDLNIGSVVRTANAFLAGRVHIVGNRRWNRRGAMVTDRYQHIEHHPDARALADHCSGAGIELIGIDNLPGALPLETALLPRRCVLLFGQEGVGLTGDAQAACGRVLSIAQFGSTRSINVGAAAAVAMHAWIRQHVFEEHPVEHQ